MDILVNEEIKFFVVLRKDFFVVLRESFFVVLRDRIFVTRSSRRRHEVTRREILRIKTELFVLQNKNDNLFYR